MYSIRIDNRGFDKKPTNNEIIKINKRLSENAAVCVDWDEFCSLVGEKGHSFCVSDFSGNIRRKEFFYSQQIFALDFDGGITYEEIISRMKKLRIPIALSYETFSSKNLDKFRIVLLHDSIITDIHISELITDVLLYLFPEADSHCRDVSRIFFGGKKLLTCNEVHFNYINLLMEFSAFLKEKYGETHYKEHLKSIAQRHSLKRRSGFIAIDDNSVSFDKKQINEKSNSEKIRNFNFDILTQKCRLFSEFLKGERWLYHDELFGIASNLNCIECGKKKFLKILESEENSQFLSYKEKDWRFYLSYMTAQTYRPMSCEKFCPYKDECNHAENMILTAKTAMNKVVKLKEKNYYTLEEAEKDLAEKLLQTVNSSANKINVIKAQTAIGKTENYISIIKNTDKKFIVAVPTNILKDEVYQRMKFAGISSVAKTYSITELESRDDEIGKTVKYLNSLGAFRDVKIYLKKMAEKKEHESLTDYIQPIESYNGARVIVTTHKKFLNASKEFLENYEIIIDEDILASSAKNTVDVRIDDLKKISEYHKVNYCLKDIKNRAYIHTESENTYIDIETMQKKGIKTNVNGFMAATAIYCDDEYVHCFIPTELQNVKCTIVSATAEEEIYKMYFRNRTVNFLECKEAKHCGKIIQDCSRSYSRRDMESDGDLLEKIIKENPDCKHVISFMKYKKECNNCKIHYGNTEGCDYMKGENILVIGTPHLNEFVYKLLATHLGINTDEKMRHQEICEDCFKFWFCTYEKPELRNIQLWFIRSELIQAVGRARILRTNAIVKLYANLPLEQAEICDG